MPPILAAFFEILRPRLLDVRRRPRGARDWAVGRESKPAAIASTASAVLTVVETRTFSNGKSPVRINQPEC
jgi:hypothetical protein